MTDDQAIQVIGYLNAAYPTNRLDDSAAKVFTNFIKPLDFESCRYVVKRWIEQKKWFPSIAEITELTKTEMHRAAPVERPALGGGRTLTREENLEWVARLKDQVARATGPLFNPRTRQAGLGDSEDPPDRPARR